MDTFIQDGVSWIVVIQAVGGWLEAPMKLFSFLGTQDFFFLALPLLYWSIDSRLGLRVGFILIASISINYYFKLLFAGPRPYWVSGEVKALSSETSFGIPSGHAQNAVSVWGAIANGNGRRWAWVAAMTLAFLIGFSRLYLGMHFVHDVIAGWLIGSVLLWAVIRYWDSAARWLKTKAMTQQVVLAFVFSLLMLALGYAAVARLDGYVFPEEYRTNALRSSGELPLPVSLETIFSSAGMIFGFALGAAWITSRGGYQADGVATKRVLRYLVGLIGVFILWRGLGAVLPRGEELIPLLLRYIRYALVGLWITAGAPWLFFRIKLSYAPKI